ncbi:MAG: hypothetical protein ACXVLT_03280 [Flavisolibacter sp.]
MKKISVIFLIIGVLVVSAYVYVRQSLATPGFNPPPAKQAASTPTKPPESPLDLKPKLVAKLQQLVKQGSNGLYNLFIHEVQPDILNSTVTITKASLVPDTAAMRKLEQSGSLPGQVFKIETDAIRIDGLGIKDILSKDVIDLKSISIVRPTIDVYSQKSGSSNQSHQTLYQRLMDQMKHIGIGKLVIENGTLITHDPGTSKSTRFNDIAVKLSDIVIDSTTQFDKNRFLFARDADLTLKNYSVPTSDNLYMFKVGTIAIKATKQLMVAKNVSLMPNYSKSEFQKHIQVQKERYDISIPEIAFTNTDWWNLVNNKQLQASSAEIGKVGVSIYLDRRKPLGKTDMKGFPDQLLMKAPIKLNIQKLKIDDLDLAYEEFNQASNQLGKLTVTGIQATVDNMTNLPGAIKRNPITTVSATGSFMNSAPAELKLVFDLSRYQTGAFTAELNARKGFDGPMVNPIAEPLGLFMVKRGRLKELLSQVQGDNHQATGNVTMLYDDLHITPLKKDAQNPGELKKKSVTSLVANAFVLKDENPSKDGEVRKEDASFTRNSGTFFNLIWKTTLVGILKTIGAPTRLAAD